MYRNTTEFFTLTLYLMTFLNSLTCSSCFVHSLGFSVRQSFCLQMTVYRAPFNLYAFCFFYLLYCTKGNILLYVLQVFLFSFYSAPPFAFLVPISMLPYPSSCYSSKTFFIFKMSTSPFHFAGWSDSHLQSISIFRYSC